MLSLLSVPMSGRESTSFSNPCYQLGIKIQSPAHQACLMDHPPSWHCPNSFWSRKSACWAHAKRGQKRNLFIVGRWHFTVYKSSPALGIDERECLWRPGRLTHRPGFWIFFPLQRWGTCHTLYDGKQTSAGIAPLLYLVLRLWLDDSCKNFSFAIQD